MHNLLEVFVSPISLDVVVPLDGPNNRCSRVPAGRPSKLRVNLAAMSTTTFAEIYVLLVP